MIIGSSSQRVGTCLPGAGRAGHSAGSLACRLLAAVLAILLVLPAALTACSSKRVLGGIDEQAPVVLIRYEAIEKDLSGIVYREILDLPTYLSETKIPVLLIFHDPSAAVERQLIPLVEQFADDCKERAAVIYIDANEKPSLVSLYGVETVPKYILVKSGAARLAMSGFDETTRAGLDQMLRSLG